MAKLKSNYRCSACHHTVAKWVGRCPECGSWGSMDEATVLAPVATRAGASGLGAGNTRSTLAPMIPTSPAAAITQISSTTSQANSTGISEFDRVLGGGLVPGSVVLLAGEPGVGKSTLLLEVVHRWARTGEDRRALYVTGEESAGQVRLRADRTGAVHERVFLAAESDLATVFGHVEQVKPSLLIVDSVQTMLAADVDGVIGGVTQVRAITSALTSLAKTTGVAVLLIGHVTKDGAVAGPRSLEHLVDVVLHFEGDKHSTLRMIRGVKNRFGASDEVGCFELRETGIVGISDPSGLFLHHRTESVAGTAVTVTMDGKRPLLAELQALVVETHMPSPRRAVSGLDSARVAMILAVLEKHCGLKIAKCEVYAATVGGMKTTEPAVDLALAAAVASGVNNVPLDPGLVILGEVGLAGEIRRVSGLGRRLAEAARLGFTHAITPPHDDPMPAGMKVRTVTNLADALTSVRPRSR
ncbi:DNA repair protein RadA [Rhodococcus sp. RS1C4]|uniref:DNA repair protein RadA n=1 Tax=Nocardiaceae TaxID=85025 RepID=UPI00035CF843|nr:MULTISPECIES: DNA repair protein RadA [Rhodococcus]OZC46925.1 DNA repair protein RadA [Rhodococcus sp. 06-621-2]OZC53079.1 DNA repair protein RadA [Rhodococcus sp. RS1C4]OZC79229.1 DNA repair protein RadA [Rhodococcus sp. 06-418-1B]OZD15027.1 DNA repair protein RadA [Rhodococcus sp. 06-156-4C]OZD19889.1 DNA repair protein RadA [Rhodococcus sp. 06-156-4a]